MTAKLKSGTWLVFITTKGGRVLTHRDRFTTSRSPNRGFRTQTWCSIRFHDPWDSRRPVLLRGLTVTPDRSPSSTRQRLRNSYPVRRLRGPTTEEPVGQDSGTPEHSLRRRGDTLSCGNYYPNGSHILKKEPNRRKMNNKMKDNLKKQFWVVISF